MIQELFRVGSFSISPFGITLVAAFFAAFLQLRWGMRKLGIGTEDDASALLFAAGLGGIIGGKIYYAILYQDWRLLFDRAGLVWYGGFLLATAAMLLVMRRRRLPYAATLDAGILGLALGYGIGRIGCFLVGDDYGKPTDLPWGVVFRVGLPKTTAGNLRYHFDVAIPPEVPDEAWVAVHPTQLYETAIALAIWGFGLWLMKGGRLRPGSLFLIVLGLLACERFGVEILRAKDDRFFAMLTVAQVISLIILLTVAMIGLWRWRRPAAA